MTLEEAIRTAIEYEIRIRDIYLEGAAVIDEEAGQRFLQALGNDEQCHIDYLEQLLVQLEQTGMITAEKLESSIPSREAIDRKAGKVQSQMAEDDHGLKQQMLSKALKMEVETSAFYNQLISDMAPAEKQIFSRFLEIENNHIDAVQFELDYISKTGYWFDIKEFDME